MHQQNFVEYQVCVDQEGEPPFDGTGTQFTEKAVALEHLKEVRLIQPHAYLATVTYQRCSDHEPVA